MVLVAFRLVRRAVDPVFNIGETLLYLAHSLVEKALATHLVVSDEISQALFEPAFGLIDLAFGSILRRCCHLDRPFRD